MSKPNLQRMPETPKGILYTLYIVLGLLPFLFVAGLDNPDLLPRLLLTQLGLLVIAIYWLYLGAPSTRTVFHLPVLIYFLFLVCSAFWAITPFRSVHFLAKHITLFSLFWILPNVLKKEHIPGLLRVTTLAATAVSFYGILEYHNIIPKSFLIPSTGRPSSTFMFRNLVAHYLVVNLPLTGLLFLLSKTQRDRLIGSVGAVFMFVFLLYTRTRGAWVGLFCATLLSLGLWFFYHRTSFLQTLRSTFDKNTRIFTIASLLCIAILGPLPAGFKEQHTQRFDEKKADISSAVTSIFKKGGDRGRTKMWEHTLTMITQTPWGVGLGNWEFAYPLYDHGDQITPDSTPRRPHNDLLWITSEMGIQGLFAYLSILLCVLYCATYIWKHSKSSQNRLIVGMTTISIFAMTGDGMFNFPYERIAPSLLFWLAISFIAICHKDETAACNSPIPKYAYHLLPILLIASIWITLKNIAFDFHYINAVRASLQYAPQTAGEEAGKAVEYGPFNHQALIIYGRSLKEQKQYLQAEKVLHRAIDYHPYFANIYNNIGHLYDEWGRLEDAKKYYMKALELMPNHHKALFNMGITLEKQGEIEKAKAAYRKSIVLSRNEFGRGNHNLGDLFNKQNQPDSAQAYYMRAITAPDPAIESYYNLGNLLAKQHRFEPAIQAYQGFLENWQGDPKWIPEAHHGLSEAYSGLGVQKEQQGAYQEAIELYKTAIAHWPENAMNWYNLGNAYRLAENPEQAISSYQKALSLDDAFTDAYNNLGLIYTDQKQYNKAIETFEEAIKIHPNQAILHLNLGNAYLGKGDVFRAIAPYKTFLKLWDQDDITAKQVQDVLKELEAATP